MPSPPPPPPSSPLHSPPHCSHPLLSLLHTCHSLKHLKAIHSQILRTGLVPSPAAHSRMLALSCTHRHLSYARLLFDAIPNPTPPLYNTIIKAYSDHRSPHSALSLYIQMLAHSSRPDNYTFPFLLKSFTRDAAIAFGDEIHAHAIKFGLGSNVFVMNALIHMYSVGGETDVAREIFDRSPKREAVMWNVMISGYNRCKQFKEACQLFVEMERQNVRPNSITVVSVLSACGKLRDLDLGVRIHRCIQHDQTVCNLKVQNALIDMYSECGEMGIALRLFEKMEDRDVVTWTSMVAGFCKSGETDRARTLFDQMPKKDAVSWTAMIDGYVRVACFKEALQMFRMMQEAKVHPDEFTMVSVLTACAQLGALEVGEWIRVYMDRNNIKVDILVGNALIDMYSKCGNVVSAMEIFRKMCRRDKFTWTAMITGLAVNGHGEVALSLFADMLTALVRPDEVTYIGVLSACTHSGLVEEGREHFSSMITAHGIMPNVTHYGCLVDLLGRAGQLEEALETITNMPMKPNSAVWGSLLGACRVYRNIEVAELAAERILELEPENGAAYVLLANVYAKCDKWEDMRKVRKMMAERGIKKKPGCSLVEMNGEVHEFVAGDLSHQRSDDIYSKLEEMMIELKVAGHKADTSEVFLDIGEEEKESAIYRHSEKLAVAFGLLSSGPGATIRIVKNLRMCLDCHNAMKLVSKVFQREVVIRDRTRFHHFRHGLCSCKDFW